MDTTNYGIIMGSDEYIKGKGICRGVVVGMQGLTIVEDFLPLKLGCTDMVLGMQWLGSLGSIEINWRLLPMMFRMGDTITSPKGDHELNKAGVSLKTMMKASQLESQGIGMENEPVQVVVIDLSSISPILEESRMMEKQLEGWSN